MREEEEEEVDDEIEVESGTASAAGKNQPRVLRGESCPDSSTTTTKPISGLQRRGGESA